MYLALTSERLQGEAVYHCGMANYFIRSEKLPAVFQEISEQISKSSNAKGVIEGVLAKYNSGEKGKQLQNEEEIKHIFEGGSVAEIYERAKGSNTGFGKGMVKALEAMCPLSVHVTFRQMK
jgi:enoyl-CoA hydratase/carnithine racemase